MSKTNKQGFTLIELAIVLVIIGLIVGGVLVGQDLIKAAQIRATVSQIEKYDAAVNAFRGKYNGLPGDLLNAGNFFSAFASATGAGGNGQGDGDGVIEAVSTAATPITSGLATSFGGENVAFWGQMTLANLIQEAASTNANSYGFATPVTVTDAAQAKLGKGRFTVIAAGGLNYYALTNIGTGAPTAGVITGNGNPLTVLEAYQIDSKKDDGIPTTGTVLSFDNLGTPATVAAASTNTTTNACYTTAAYNISSYGNTANCSLSIRTSF